MTFLQEDYKNIDYSPYKICIADPPWGYMDNSNPAVNRRQITYTRWDNTEGLEFIFNQDFDYIFLWVTNSLLEQVFVSNYREKYEYKQAVTWVKTTTKGNYCFGLGNNFRNCTEQLLLFVRKRCKPLRLNVRNLIVEESKERTQKPKQFEHFLINFLEEERGFRNQICYMFSGPSEEYFQDTGITLIDNCNVVVEDIDDSI